MASRVQTVLIGLAVLAAPECASSAESRAPTAAAQLEDGRPRGLPLDAEAREKHDAGWTIALDNDLLSFADRDYDYTGGVAITLAGRRAREAWHSLDPVARQFEPLLPRRSLDAAATEVALHSLQLGLIAFTPDDLNSREPLPQDRPYASLLFQANSRTFVTHPDEPVYEVTVVLGVLGLDAAEAVQRAIHTGLDLDRIPRGWDYQISDGGEPTGRVVWARQQLLASNYQSASTEYEWKWRTEASVGFLTETSVALSGRWGLINTPWWSFTPERADYVSQPAPVIGNALGASARELYLWGGVKVRARLYNAFLQGQFRDSVVTVDSDRLEPLIGEAWLGVTWQFSRDYRVGYVVRYQSREIEDGPASRSLVWAGLIFSRDL